VPAIKRGILKTQEGVPVLLEFITSKEEEVSRQGTLSGTAEVPVQRGFGSCPYSGAGGPLQNMTTLSDCPLSSSQPCRQLRTIGPAFV